MTAAQLKQPIESEETRHAWASFSELRDMLSGDAVLLPFKDGQPDWDNTTRDSLEKISHYGDFTAADIPRLAILTDGFDRFIGKGADVSVVTLWQNGTPIIQQIDGEPCARALDLMLEAIVDDLSLEDVTGTPFADPLPATPKAATPPVADNDNKPSAFIDAQTLLSLHFEPIKYVIPGFVAEGLTLLGGRPKLGKSWLALDFGIAVATGGKSLGVECAPGDAIYLALEDNQRRLQDRLKTVLPRTGRPDMSRLSLLTEAPKINAGLIDALEAWRTRVSDPRLVIIDTLAMVRAEKKRNQDSYSADYEALSPLQRYASQHRLAIVVVTHVRKAEAEDPLEMISGTNGLTGAADSIMILNRTADGPKLYGRGRDVEEVEKALKFDGGKWSVLGNVDDVKRSDQRHKIIDALMEAGKPMGPSDIATATGLKPPNVRYLLGKMVKAGEAEKCEFGLYVTPSHPSHRSQSNVIFPPSQCINAECEGCEDCEEGTPHNG